MNILAKIYQILDQIPIIKKFGSKKVLQISGVVILSLILLIVFMPKHENSDFEGLTAIVKQGDFTVSIIESGDIQAESQVFIAAPSIYGGSLQIIDLISEGTIVKQGDFLIQFDTSNLELQKSLREDELASLRADLKKMISQHSLTISNLKSSLKLSEYSYEQAKLSLKIRQFESEASKEEARLQLKQAEIDLARTKKQLESQKIINRSQIIKIKSSIKQAENRLKTIVENIKECTVRAPASGMVVYQEVGSWTSRERLKNGYTARRGESLMSIPDLSSMQVKFFVNEIDRQRVRQGQKVSINLEAYPDVIMSGKIINVSQLAQPVRWGSNLKGFAVLASIDSTNDILKPGMTAQVSVELNHYNDVVYIPVGAVFEYKGQTVIFPKKKKKPYVVYLGERNDKYVIVEKGAEKGMELLLTDPEGKAHLLGYSEENRRIEKVKKVMENSFNVFEKLGTLYKYSSEVKSDGKQGKSNAPALPSFLKKRLQKGGNAAEKNKEEMKSNGDSGQNTMKKFNLTPEMMKRLKKSSKKSGENQK
ncbi:HlyD family efflux transporter periplasmic adaptor subunit [bacterium]|nr:HlyD family efflux transporter periplasmic adaptor subunit [bacterium]